MKAHLRGIVLERLWYHPTFSSFSDPFLSIKLLSLSFLLRPPVAIPPPTLDSPSENESQNNVFIP